VEDDYVKGNYLLVIGYREGIKAEARFGYINGLITDPINDTFLWISDQDNGCLRYVKRDNNRTAELLGKCTSRYIKNGRLQEAGVAYPFGLTSRKFLQNTIYFFEGEAKIIKSISKVDTEWYVNTVYELEKSISGMIFDPTGSYLYFTTNSGIIRVSTTWDNQPETVISGFGHNDGNLDSVKVRDPKRMLFLDYNTFLLADYKNHVLRVVDLGTFSVSTICVPQVDDATVSEGSVDTCRIKFPRQLVKSTNSSKLYLIGDTSASKLYLIGDTSVFEINYSGELASIFF